MIDPTPAGNDRAIDLSDLPNAISQIQQSSKRSLWLVGVVLALVLAMAVGIVYYIVSLSSDLVEARTHLAASNVALQHARYRLNDVQSTLDKLRANERNTAATSVFTALLETASSDLSAGKRDLQNASRSIGKANDSLPTDASVRGDPTKWYAVVATYYANDKGLALAKQMASGLPQAECVQIWRTKADPKYAVTVGGIMNQQDAQQKVAALISGQTVRDAFAQFDREWSLVDQSSQCNAAQSTPVE